MPRDQPWNLALSAVQGTAVALGVFLGEMLRTGAWRIPTPHSAEALFGISVFFATLAAATAALASLAAFWSRAWLLRTPVPSLGHAFLLTLAAGVVVVPVAQLPSPAGAAGAWILLITAPGVVAWLSEWLVTRRQAS